MPKPFKSQWDFGELFPPAAYRHVLSVSELTGQIRNVLEQQVGRIWVVGEISNLRVQSSGHAYFSIKDATAQLSCVLFRGEARGIERDLLADGKKVVLEGEVTVYEARGQYQLRVLTLEWHGAGALQAAFEKLKQTLAAEGLFAPERKRPLPRCIQHIGIVTSSSGAALQDVVHVVRRRFSGLLMTLAACRVQGQGAAEEIACAIGLLNDWAKRAPAPPLDAILVTRGGGSLEDLWAFNEEVVARAIFNSLIPVISAVGHEIDFSISDFVADLRAATPSAAAEIVTEGMFAARRHVLDLTIELSQRTADAIEARRSMLQQFRNQLRRVHPRRRVQERGQRLDDLRASLVRCLRYAARERRQHWIALAQRLWRVRPEMVFEMRRQRLVESIETLRSGVMQALQRERTQLAGLENRLRLLSPRHVLERGYSITCDAETGAVIRHADRLQSGQRLRTTLAHGTTESIVQRDEGTAR